MISDTKPHISTIILSLIGLLVSGCGEMNRNVKSDGSEQNPSDIYVQLGIAYLQEGDYDIALTKAQKALTFDSHNANAYNVMALIYARLGDHPNADAQFQKAMELAPSDVSIVNNYAQYLCQMGRVDEAKVNFQKVIVQENIKERQTAYTNAGICAAKNNELVEAETYFNNALMISGDFPAAILELAHLKFRATKYTEALELLSRYQKVAELNPRGLKLAVDIERKLGKLESAEAYLEALINNYPDSEEARELIRSP